MSLWLWILLAFGLGGALGYVLGSVRTSRWLIRTSRLRYD